MRVLDWRTLKGAPLPVTCRWRYGLLVEDIEIKGFQCESYGIVLTDDRTGEESRCRHISVNAEDAVALLAMLVRNSVTPSTLHDVVEDWLGR